MKEHMADQKTNLFDRCIHTIVYSGKHIERIFFLLTLICLICYPFVQVNYDLSEYLPSSAPTRQALDVMENEFGYPGMARVMVTDCTMQEARAIREQIADVPGVSLVVGADLATNVYANNAFLSNDLTDEFYKDGNAVMEIVFEDGDTDSSTHKAIDQIQSIIGERGRYSGAAVSDKEKEESIQRELAFAIVLALVIILAILVITTTSWFEPLLFIAVMCIAIIINLGSNLIFGTISFFTFSTAAIFQLAVSMDYSIFLLHTFTAYKQSGMEIHQAMETALKEACKSILASGATTAVGFLVLVSMEFTVGKDLGLVLTKGIICSLATVLFLMPALILRFNERIERTAHKPFFRSFDGLSKIMFRIRIPILILALLLAVPCFIGQSMNTFYYGNEALGCGPGTRYYEDTQQINAVFGKSNVVLAIVPTEENGSLVRERELTEALDDLDFVNYALSLGNALPEGVPTDFLPKQLLSELHTDRYARILISMNNQEESEYSFACSERLSETVSQYYPEDAYVIGMTPTVMDIRDILTADYNRVSKLSLLGVAIVVMLTFRCILVPILVIVPIEVAIYLNMTLPYVMGDWMLYIGYIIVSCLQLGATIDYSILLTNNYLSERQSHPRKEAALAAISRSALSVLTSGLILTVVGYLLFFTSSMQSISQIGRLVGRGALLSMGLVLSLLPAMLYTFDRSIMKAQHRAQNRGKTKLVPLAWHPSKPAHLPIRKKTARRTSKPAASGSQLQSDIKE